MVYAVKILPIALKDLRNAKIWYQEQSENLGEEFKKKSIKKLIISVKTPIISNSNTNLFVKL